MGLLVVVAAMVLLVCLLDSQRRDFQRLTRLSEGELLLQQWMAATSRHAVATGNTYATDEQRLVDLLPTAQQGEARHKHYAIVKGKKCEWLLNWGAYSCNVSRRRFNTTSLWTRLCVTQSGATSSGPGIALTMYLWIALDEEHLYKTANVM